MKKIKAKFLAGLVAGAICFGSMPALATETNISVEVNGKRVAFSNQNPQVISGTTYVPLRGVFEELGYEVKWEATSKTIKMTSDDTSITLKQDSTYTLNNEQKKLQNKILVISGSTMLPLREVSTLVGAKVDWNANTKTVIITNDETSNLPTLTAKDEAAQQVMREYAQIMEKRRETLNELADKYDIYMHFTDIADEDIPSYMEDYKLVNDGDIEAVKAIEADEDFNDVKEKTNKLLNKCTEVMKMYLIDKVPDGPETVSWTSDLEVKKAILAYCKKKGLNAKEFFPEINEEESYSDVVKFY